jgi:hypothetical protein
MMPDPRLRATVFLLTAERREIEEIVRIQRKVQPSLVGRVRVIHGTVLTQEHAEARQFALGRPQFSTRHEVGRVREVVLHAAQIGIQGDVEVIVEIRAERRYPRKRPSHAMLERLDFRERRA